MKSYLATSEFWLGAGERAARTAAWVLASTLGLPQIGASVGVDVLNVGWKSALSFAVGAALLSVLGSIAAGKVSPDGSPSLVDDRPSPAEVSR
ncbi:MAG TPA: holin [Jiangellaceae bacterium]|nr:holin [Jiangellaceae bacterium]